MKTAFVLLTTLVLGSATGARLRQLQRTGAVLQSAQLAVAEIGANATANASSSEEAEVSCYWFHPACFGYEAEAMSLDKELDEEISAYDKIMEDMITLSQTRGEDFESCTTPDEIESLTASLHDQRVRAEHRIGDLQSRMEELAFKMKANGCFECYEKEFIENNKKIQDAMTFIQGHQCTLYDQAIGTAVGALDLALKALVPPIQAQVVAMAPFCALEKIIEEHFATAPSTGEQLVLNEKKILTELALSKMTEHLSEALKEEVTSALVKVFDDVSRILCSELQLQEGTCKYTTATIQQIGFAVVNMACGEYVTALWKLLRPAILCRVTNPLEAHNNTCGEELDLDCALWGPGERAVDTPTRPSLVNLGKSGCTSKRPCGKCQGDCDADSQCAGNLKCGKRSGYALIPGCLEGGKKDYDYCYDPDDGMLPLQNLGKTGCTEKNPCSQCQGDCDSDSDCEIGLKCFKRDGKTKVPGCAPGGSGDKSNYDFCYDPKQGHPTYFPLAGKGIYHNDAAAKDLLFANYCNLGEYLLACQTKCDSDPECAAFVDDNSRPSQRTCRFKKQGGKPVDRDEKTVYSKAKWGCGKFQWRKYCLSAGLKTYNLGANNAPKDAMIDYSTCGKLNDDDFTQCCDRVCERFALESRQKDGVPMEGCCFANEFQKNSKGEKQCSFLPQASVSMEDIPKANVGRHAKYASKCSWETKLD